MRLVIPQELLGLEKLNYDLYNERGEVIYKSGDPLTSNLLISLTQKKIYRENNPLKADSNLAKLHKYPTKQEFKSVIPEKVTKSLLESTKKILKVTLEGNTPDISACINTRDMIIDQVGKKLDKIECIGQLRIFDEYTFAHTVNVSTLCAAIAMVLKLTDKEIQDITLGGLLHDIGKMRVPIEILNKPGKLTSDEFEFIKNHTWFGYEIITNEMRLPEHIAKVALEHQERYGGGGYPLGLKGDKITLFGQISSVADVYDALVSNRVYKNAVLSEAAVQIMLSEGVKSFNPIILAKFTKLANFNNERNQKS